MVTFKDIVIVALLRRMGGPQYLEWDELESVEQPQFTKDGEYLVVRSTGDEEEQPQPCATDHETCATDHENGTGSQRDATIKGEWMLPPNSG